MNYLHPYLRLTRTQLAVMRLHVEGHTPELIQCLAPMILELGTVKNYISIACGKLGLHSSERAALREILTKWYPDMSDPAFS